MLHHFPLHRVTLQVFTSLYFILHYLVTLLYITTSQYVSLKIAPFSQLHLPCFVRSHPRAHPEVRLLTAEIRFGRTHAAGFVGEVWVYLWEQKDGSKKSRVKISMVNLTRKKTHPSILVTKYGGLRKPSTTGGCFFIVFTTREIYICIWYVCIWYVYDYKQYI